MLHFLWLAAVLVAVVLQFSGWLVAAAIVWLVAVLRFVQIAQAVMETVGSTTTTTTKTKTKTTETTKTTTPFTRFYTRQTF